MKQQSDSQTTAHAPARKPALGAVGHSRRPMQAGEQAGSPTREDTIRLAAYGFYEARGRIDGHELEDWLRAEGEVAQAQPAAAAGAIRPGH